MRGLLSETVNHKLSAEGIILWVPTLVSRGIFAAHILDALLSGAQAVPSDFIE